jgi:hypothetical protein
LEQLIASIDTTLARSDNVGAVVMRLRRLGSLSPISRIGPEPAAQPRGYDEDRACPWARVCTCDHVRCYRGWLDAEDVPLLTRGGNLGRGPAWCPTCAAARVRIAHLR